MKKKQTTSLPTATEPPNIFQRIHLNVLGLNNSKFFAGLVMIMLNVGSKFIPIQFSKSAEEYLKQNLSKAMLVFAMSWMGTRDIYTAIILTVIFIILSDYLFNEESVFCIVPSNKRVLENIKSKEKETDPAEAPTKDDISKQTLQLIEKTKNIIIPNNK
jgi:DNA integrity scanning protein DisA with diadenylate cyclase activity